MWLGGSLPSNWTAARPPAAAGDGRTNGVIRVSAPGGAAATISVRSVDGLFPRDLQRLIPSVVSAAEALGEDAATLLVAPWLSGRSQELLEKAGLNYLDLTGNVLIRLDEPAVFIRTEGAERNPEPPSRSLPNVRGPKAGRLIRLLIDVMPPYGVREIARAAELAPGYVSRLLDSLDREALVTRSDRGVVESVDIGGLIDRWAGSYKIFKSNEPHGFIAPDGPARALVPLIKAKMDVAVTGSFAAVRLIRVAPPRLLLLYTNDIDGTAKALGLEPTAKDADVVLLSPFDSVVWDRRMNAGGLSYVAISQRAIDCLTGIGHMPQEGEALVEWMLEHEKSWRLPSLQSSDGS